VHRAGEAISPFGQSRSSDLRELSRRDTSCAVGANSGTAAAIVGQIDPTFNGNSGSVLLGPSPVEPARDGAPGIGGRPNGAQANKDSALTNGSIPS